MPYAGMSDQRNSRGLRELAFALLLQRATLRTHEEEAFTLVWGPLHRCFLSGLGSDTTFFVNLSLYLSPIFEGFTLFFFVDGHVLL